VTSSSTGTAALVEVAHERWDPLLERIGCGDAYLLRGSVESACLLEPGRPLLLHLSEEGGEVVFALILREIEGESGRRDAITPYGYGGPVGAGPEPPIEHFYELYESWCRSAGVVSTFIRFHPLFANQRQAQAGIHVERSCSEFPEYPQLWGPFVSGLSILDLLFNCGPMSRAYLEKSRRVV